MRASFHFAALSGAVVVLTGFATPAFADQAALERDFDLFLKQQEAATEAFVNGDPEPTAQQMPEKLPMVLMGGAGGFETDAAATRERFKTISSLYRGGTVSFEYVAKVVTPEMAYTVGTERRVIRIGGREPQETNLRATQIYRKEGDQWKLVVRHADPFVEYTVPTAASFAPPGGSN